MTLFLSLQKASIRLSETLKYSSMLYNAKFCQQIQNHFSGKGRLPLKLCEDFFSMLDVPIDLF